LHHPQHVTLRFVDGLPTLRQELFVKVLRRALKAGKERFGLRVVHYSIQHNHLHCVVEAVDRRALRRGMHGLDIRIARAINHVLARHGRVIGDRYHARALRTPREVRNVLAYVLMNASRCTSRASRFTGTLSKPRMSVALFRRARRTRRELTPDKSSSAVSLSSSLYLDLRYCSCLPKHT